MNNSATKSRGNLFGPPNILLFCTSRIAQQLIPGFRESSWNPIFPPWWTLLIPCLRRVMDFLLFSEVMNFFFCSSRGNKINATPCIQLSVPFGSFMFKCHYDIKIVVLHWSIRPQQMSWGFSLEVESTGNGKSDHKHLLPLCILWPIIGGCAHTSKWQGSSRLKRNKKQRCIKSEWETLLRATRTLKHCSIRTVRRVKDPQRQIERGGVGRDGEGDIDFPLCEVPVHHSVRHTLSIPCL